MDLLVYLFTAIFVNAGEVAGLSLAILPFLGMPGPLRDPEPDPGGGGDDPPLNEKQTAAINKLITDQLNGAVTRIEKTIIPGALKGVSDAVTSIKTSIEGLTKKEDPADPPDPKLDKLSPETRAALEAKDRKVNKLENDLKAMQDQLKEEGSKREQTERHALLRTEIAKHKLRDDVEDVPGQIFRILSGDVRRAEDGSIIAGPEGQELPLGDYVKGYFEKSGKIFLAPAGSGGSGNRGGERPNGKGSVGLEDLQPGKMTKETKEAGWAAVRSAL
jgi:hypothetical protein